MFPESIRIAVCGDEAVGKSSLITSLIKENISESQVNNVLPPITISKNDYIESLQELPEMGKQQSQPRARKHKGKAELLRLQTLNSKEVSDIIPNTTVVTDTSASDPGNLQKELKRADVIWLTYSDHYTYERISLHWMPMFRSLGVNLPIILCANKADLSPKSSWKNQNAEEFIPLINEFKEIEAGVRCSAKNNYNVVEAFYLCQRAVTHPISPIFDAKEGNLKPGAIAALKRVFFLFDTDQDGYLNFDEFNELHKKCFRVAAAESDFNDIVNYIDSKICQDLLSAPKSGCISEDGFVLLNKLYAESGRHETIWCILRANHYTNSLSLDDKFLFPHLDVNLNSSVELSPNGFRFLVDLFIKFDKDNDGGLSEDELNNLFRPTPGIPKLWIETNFPSSIVCNEEGYVTLQGWLAQWNLTTFLSYKTTLEYLAYLGFDAGNSIKALKLTKPRKCRQKQGRIYRTSVNDKNIYNCFVVGAPRAGKSSLLDSFLHGSYSEVYSHTKQPRLVIKDIELRGGKQCYLILEELAESEGAILENQKRLDECDVICYTYDSSDPESFQYLVDLRQKYPHLDEIPSVFAALKADLDKQQQRSDVQPETYTRDLFLNSPLHISSSWTSSLHELFIQLVDAANKPQSATPGLEFNNAAVDQENLKHLMMAGGALGIMALVSIWMLNSMRR
ncbi:GEM1 [Candida oxycetoniae]|uniref:Mitochondrial Rho GTPase n=1 Tax=Candida oxycetoniae TaxID=497107 RepID=A0AAI9SUM0_9ASCO|nr:GEM1 [Candida oxycetoniae]KAI3403206.2 GEM1 [Candida oxycetoniae]